MYTRIYAQVIRKRGPFGIPYAVVKFRTAHMDERSWRRMRGRRFSMADLLGHITPTGE